MTVFWVNLLFGAGAYLLQYYVLPQFAPGAWVPELLVASVCVSSMYYGARWALPFAFFFGMACELILGYGYGMYLLPLVLCAFFFQYLSSLSFDRPWYAAALVGAGAFLARLVRALLLWGSGHGAMPGGGDWVQILAACFLTALCALVMIYAHDRRQRRGKFGRYEW